MSSSSSKVDLSKAIGFQAAPLKVVYNSRDLMLYALSIGVHSEELHFLYENDPAFAAFQPIQLFSALNSIEILRPLPTEGGSFELLSQVSGKGMVIERTVQMVDPKDPLRPYSTMKGSVFVRGAGGWGGPKGLEQESKSPLNHPRIKHPIMFTRMSRMRIRLSLSSL
ncbi:hypothetical protein BGZ65_000907, partial [Modicella reniformis]